MASYNDRIIEEFRANHGRVGGNFEGAPLLLLHHRGAKSGTAYVSPVMYQDLDGSYAVFASAAGQQNNPAWYHNLLAHNETTVEIGDSTVDVRVREATGGERDRIWSAQKAAYPGFADYERRTDRTIPVLVLEPLR